MLMARKHTGTVAPQGMPAAAPSKVLGEVPASGSPEASAKARDMWKQQRAALAAKRQPSVPGDSGTPPSGRVTAPAVLPASPAAQPQESELEPEQPPEADELQEGEEPGEEQPQEPQRDHLRKRLRDLSDALKATSKGGEAHIAALQQQNQLLVQLLSQQRGPTAPAQQAPQSLLPFQEPFPENGSHEDQERWRYRKEAWETAQQQWPKVLQAYDQYRQPIDSAVLEIVKDREWDKVKPKLDRLGVARTDIEELVVAKMQIPGNQNRSLGSLINDIVDEHGLDEVPQAPVETPVPLVTRPGAGRSTIPTQSPQRRRELTPAQQALARARAAAKSGNMIESDAAVRDYFRSGAVQARRK